MMSQAGIPRGLPDSFTKKYLSWESKLENYGLSTEIIEATTKLSIDQLLICLCNGTSKWMPTLHCELDWVALVELSKRKLSKNDLEKIKNAWNGRKHTIKDSRYKVVQSIKDKQRLDILLKKIN